MGSRVQSTVGCFSELCFLQFSVAQVLVGLRKQYINNLVFFRLGCASGFNNNNNYIIIGYKLNTFIVKKYCLKSASL